MRFNMHHQFIVAQQLLLRIIINARASGFIKLKNSGAFIMLSQQTFFLNA